MARSTFALNLLLFAAASACATNLLHRAGSPIVMDGRLIEPCWSNAAARAVHVVHGTKGVTNDAPPMLVRATWDDRFYYIGYEFFDTNITAYGTGVFEGPADRPRECARISPGADAPGCDVAEFFLSWGSPAFFWELHHNASNCFSDVWCAVLPESHPDAGAPPFAYGIYFGREATLRDEGANRLESAVHLLPRADGHPSTINDASDVDTGYSAEIRIPWGAFAPRSLARFQGRGEPPAWHPSGATLWMLSVCQNPDTGHRYHHDSPSFPGGWFHHGAKFWPRYRLVDPAEESETSNP
ncbi:MAG: hypothetical protein ACOX5G_00525 [Kiritimatiellia bacterium]|jgi:hypothetical protein